MKNKKAVGENELPRLPDKVTAAAGGFRQMTAGVDLEREAEEARGIRAQYATLGDAVEVVEVNAAGREVLTVWRPWGATDYGNTRDEVREARGVTRAVNRAASNRRRSW